MDNPEKPTTEKNDPDLQHILPTELRIRWRIVPQWTLYQLFIVGAFVGAGIASLIAGWVTGNQIMIAIAPTMMLAAHIQGWCLKGWQRRDEADVAKFPSRDSS